MDRDQLIELFEYDLWANARWFEFLQGKRWPRAEAAVFAHLLSASTVWLFRCQGASPSAPPEVELNELALRHVSHEWMEVIRSQDLDDIVSFRRFTGEASTMSCRRIALQVINHGTYHRGDLRGLLRARGEDDQPETDLMIFYLERDASS